MVRELVGGVLLCCLLAACAPKVEWTPGPVITERPTPSAATPTAAGSGSETPAPATPAPLTVPDATGAIDATAFESAHFASPSGRIWCAVHEDWALCHFPRGMNASNVPTSEEVCPGAELDVTGVSVIETADYFCSGGAESLPQTNGLYVGWWKKAKLPSVTYDGQKLAVLPYGRKIAKGSYVCASEKAGITCGNPTTGKGFRVALAGVDLIG